jgi:hypothetical protein
VYPDNVRAHSNLGVVYWQAGARDLALQHLRAAHRLEPQDRTVVINLADVLVQNGEATQARQVCATYATAHPEDADIRALLADLDGTVVATTAAEQGRGAVSQYTAPTAENFAYFTYSKRAHWQDLEVPPFHRDKNPDDCDLKVYQDMLIYNFITRNIKPGARLLEIGGGGRSRIIHALKDQYEFWDIDKLEGVGHGPTVMPSAPGFRMVREYIGAYSAELPDNYFDCVYSISTLEHVEGNDQTFKDICKDMDRVLKRGGYSVHCFDVVLRLAGEAFWTGGLLKYFYTHVPVINPFVDFTSIRHDADKYCMSKTAYERLWMRHTKEPHERFGMPLSYNLLWRKSDLPYDMEMLYQRVMDKSG